MNYAQCDTVKRCDRKLCIISQLASITPLSHGIAWVNHNFIHPATTVHFERLLINLLFAQQESGAAAIGCHSQAGMLAAVFLLRNTVCHFLIRCP